MTVLLNQEKTIRLDIDKVGNQPRQITLGFLQ